jgi:predicted nucleic acid-binding protein
VAREPASGPLLDEVARKAGAEHWRTKLGSEAQGIDLPQFARLQLAQLTAIVAPDIALGSIPRYTADPEDDYLVATALAAKAPFIISDDKGVAPDSDEPMTYTDEETGASVNAYQPMSFVEAEVDCLHFAIHDVDPRLLALVHRPAWRSSAGVAGDI